MALSGRVGSWGALIKGLLVLSGGSGQARGVEEDERASNC